jgi:hypothetical protein
MSRLAENPSTDLTQIELSDHHVEEDEAEGVECSKAYKMLIQFVTSEEKLAAQKAQRGVAKFEMKSFGKRWMLLVERGVQEWESFRVWVFFNISHMESWQANWHLVPYNI